MNPQAGIPFYAEGSALTRGMAVIGGTNRDQVKLGSGANLAVLGFVINDCDQDQEVSIFPVNGAGKCKGIAGASFDKDDFLMLEGADGRLKKLTPGTSLQYCCGRALEAGEDGQLVDILPFQFISVGAGA